MNANKAADAWPNQNGYAHYAKKVAYGEVAHQYQREDDEVDGNLVGVRQLTKIRQQQQLRLQGQ